MTPPSHVMSQWLARYIRERFPTGRFSLLDVGGDGRLADYFPDADYVRAEPANLAVDRAFDLVVCCYVVECVPVERRETFLDALCGLAPRIMLVSAVLDERADLSAWYQAIGEITGAAWAKERAGCAMPALDVLTSYCHRRGYTHSLKPQGSKPLSLAMAFLDHFSQSGPPDEVARINRLFDALPVSDLDDAAWPDAWLIDIDTRSELDVTKLSTTAVPVATSASLESGGMLAGRYRIVRLLGRGGMGEVYLAEDTRLSQTVALKFLPPSLAADPLRFEQFHNEVRVARQVSHPNVCRVYDIGEDAGRLFLSMEYVEGDDLAKALSDGPLDEARAIDVTRQLCAGLAAVHASGVLHRDLKPANVMLDRDGRVRIMDFGLAGIGTEAGSTSGTPGYMAPEQLSGAAATVQSDIYALGLVLFEVFTGRRRFTARTLEELKRQHAEGSASPTGWLSTLDSSVTRAIMACLDVDPMRRPGSALDVSAMTQTVLLDASATAKRLLQQIVPVTAVLALVVGTVLWLLGDVAIGVTAVSASLVLAVISTRLSLNWVVHHKGHRIRFENHPFLGERLFIDDVLVARGGVGLRKTLRGTIERGDGAGERITATSVAGPRVFSCRIVSERFGASD
jgi:serine/threonine protein kinase